ncbi:MAG: DoxX family protein [Chitinophagales bacterium]
MNWNKQLDIWTEKNLPGLILGLRITLGTALLLIGFLFMFNINDLTEKVHTTGMESFNVSFALIVAWCHMLGGLAIGVGLLTRISCLIQVPILLGAVFYVNMRDGFINSPQWIMSLVILYLVIFFFFYGGGKFSLTNLFEGREEEDAIPTKAEHL